MAAKAQETQQGQTTDEAVDGALMDVMAAAVKKMIAKAKERGYVSYDEINAVLPQDQVTSEQIEDTLAMLSEMGITVVDNEEQEEEEQARPDDEDKPHSGRQHLRRGRRPHRRSRAHVPARDGLGRAAVARGRNRHRQAHRGRPRGDDRAACAKAR